jgi:NAD(P)-dependent dehydrogenase (short-subunit alcohol dehydrogenase family)
MIGPGRNALVVGAGQGIGRAVAEALADAGCLVIAVDIDQEAVESVAVGITGRGGSAVARAVDIARPASVDDLFGWIADTFGTLDAAANVAGVTSAPALLADVSLSEFRRVTEVNLTGVFLAMQHELRLMLAAGSGAIVNISSAAGIVGVPGAAAYTASKHAVIGLTRSAAAEYIAGGIRINCVAPSHIDTPMLRASLETAADPADAQAKLLRSVPAQRLGSPSDVANAAVFLLSDQAAYLAGSILSVDGGYVAV